MGVVSHKTLTSNEGQGHSNWHQNIDFRSLCHHTNLKRNWQVNVWIQTNVDNVKVVCCCWVCLFVVFCCCCFVGFFFGGGGGGGDYYILI